LGGCPNLFVDANPFFKNFHPANIFVGTRFGLRLQSNLATQFRNNRQWLYQHHGGEAFLNSKSELFNFAKFDADETSHV
jgi:hypothetical protein